MPLVHTHIRLRDTRAVRTLLRAAMTLLREDKIDAESGYDGDITLARSEASACCYVNRLINRRAAISCLLS